MSWFFVDESFSYYSQGNVLFYFYLHIFLLECDIIECTQKSSIQYNTIRLIWNSPISGIVASLRLLLTDQKSSLHGGSRVRSNMRLRNMVVVDKCAEIFRVWTLLSSAVLKILVGLSSNSWFLRDSDRLAWCLDPKRFIKVTAHALTMPLLLVIKHLRGQNLTNKKHFPSNK